MKKFAIAFVVVCLAVACSLLPVSAAGSYVRGDANGDGQVSIGDVTAIQRHLADLNRLNSKGIKASDVDGKGFTIEDATYIQKYLAKFDNVYEIGELVKDYELPFVGT